MNSWAIFGIIIACSVVLLAITYVIIGILSYNLSVRRKTLVGKFVLKTIDSSLEIYKIDRSWWDRQEVEELQILSGKDKLFGYLIKNKRKLIKLQ